MNINRKYVDSICVICGKIINEPDLELCDQHYYHQGDIPLTPKELLYDFAKSKGIKLRHTPSARAYVTDPYLLTAIDDSYFRNCIVTLPFSRDIQLKLSWNADIWDPTASILPDRSRMFCGVNHGKRYAIILVCTTCGEFGDRNDIICSKCEETGKLLENA